MNVLKNVSTSLTSMLSWLCFWVLGAFAADADSELPEWLLEHGFTGRVRIAHQERSGRGLKATADLAAGEEVLAVPLKHVFALENLENFVAEHHKSTSNPTELLQYVDDMNADLLPLDKLAVALVACRPVDFLEKLLPQEIPNHPLFYTEDDWTFVDKLVSSSVLRSVWDDFVQSWQRVNSVGRSALVNSEYRWAHSILRSRGHSLRIRAAEKTWRTIWGLIPLADFLNMGEDPNVDCSTTYSPGFWGFQGNFSCITRRAVRKDEDLLAEYISSSARRTSAVVLREYAFVPVDNMHDALCFLPFGCATLSCMFRIQELAQLETYFGESGIKFVKEALENNSALTDKTKTDLKLLAEQEQKLLLSLLDEHERSQVPKLLYSQWRGSNAETSQSTQVQRLMEVLRDPSRLHTVAWDQALWDAGQHLLKDWDDLLASELLFSHHDFVPELELLFRRRRQDSFDKPLLQCAFSAQALLNGFAWPISEAEHVALQTVEVGSSVRSMYFPEAINQTSCPRAAALEAEREWEIKEPIRSCAGWNGGDTRVHQLYNSYPYPSWRRFASLSEDDLRKTKVKRSLIAGVGTGKAVLAHLEHFLPEEIVAVDLSKRSLQVAKRQLLALGIRHVTLLQCDLTTLPSQFHDEFDVIESVGVLHHLPDPKLGLASLKRLLAPDGVLVVGLYSRLARRSIPVMRRLAEETTPEKFRDWLVQDSREFSGRSLNSEEENYKKEFLAEFSLGSRSNFEDLLFHPVEHVYELPEVEALFLATGLRFTGVRVPAGSHGVADRWSPFFAPERKQIAGWPQMPLLAFLHRLETEMEPLLFTNMYVFTASHDSHKSSAVLQEMSRWVGKDTPEAEELPLPFEEEWPNSLLHQAVAVYCSRVLCLANGTGRWLSPSVEAWLEAKVAFGTHAARVARSLGTVDAALKYCSLLKAHFQVSWRNLWSVCLRHFFLTEGRLDHLAFFRNGSFVLESSAVGKQSWKTWAGSPQLNLQCFARFVWTLAVLNPCRWAMRWTLQLRLPWRKRMEWWSHLLEGTGLDRFLKDSSGSFRGYPSL